MRRARKQFLVQLMVATLWACGWGSRASSDIVYWSEYTSGFGVVKQMDVATGVISTLVTGTGYGPGGNHIDYPIALTLDKNGNVYVGNANNGDIVKVTPQGVASDYFGVSDPTHYPHTYGLTFDPSGNLYIAMMAQNQVAKLPPGGPSESVLASGLDAPQGGVSDLSGNIYVGTSATAGGATFIKITPAGQTSTFANNINGLFWDAAGDLYTGVGGAVTVTTPGDTVSTLVSGLTSPFPFGIDASGNLYVFEGAYADRIDLVSPGGHVTLLGTEPDILDYVVSVPEPPVAVGAFCLAAIRMLRRRARRATGRWRCLGKRPCRGVG